MKTRELVARLRAEGRCGCGQPLYAVRSSGHRLSKCAYCLDLIAWCARTRRLGIPISEAGERPVATDYIDGRRRLKPLPFKHAGMQEPMT